MGMRNKMYLLDDEPISAIELIKLASDYDRDYKDESLKTTSKAADILRKHGHIIGYNKEV